MSIPVCVLKILFSELRYILIYAILLLVVIYYTICQKENSIESSLILLFGYKILFTYSCLWKQWRSYHIRQSHYTSLKLKRKSHLLCWIMEIVNPGKLLWKVVNFFQCVSYLKIKDTCLFSLWIITLKSINAIILQSIIIKREKGSINT